MFYANQRFVFKGNVCSPDGSKLIAIEKVCSIEDGQDLGKSAGAEFLQNEEAQQIIYNIRNAEK
jgi:porphobilinogen deaminase